jgi:hypothetical protein
MPCALVRLAGMYGKSNEIKEEILNEGTIVRERFASQTLAARCLEV